MEDRDRKGTEASLYEEISRAGSEAGIAGWDPPLATGEFAFKAIEQAIGQLHLSLVQRRHGPALPELRLDQYRIKCVLRLNKFRFDAG